MQPITSTLALAALLALAASSAALATPMEYTFSPDATVTGSTGDTEAVTGSFYYDSSTQIFSDITITLTGPGYEAGTYDSQPFTERNSPDSSATFIEVHKASAPWKLFLYLTTSGLDAGTPSPIINPGTNFYLVSETIDPGTTSYYTATAGDAVPVAAPVPEPASIALLSAGLMSLGWVRRRLTPSRR